MTHVPCITVRVIFPPVYPPLKPTLLPCRSRPEHTLHLPFSTAVSTSSSLKDAVSQQMSSSMFYCWRAFPPCTFVHALPLRGLAKCYPALFLCLYRFFLVFLPCDVCCIQVLVLSFLICALCGEFFFFFLCSATILSLCFRSYRMSTLRGILFGSGDFAECAVLQ